jgi:dipeptidyl aminopeptidase/acylaminoacyl peptidase
MSPVTRCRITLFLCSLTYFVLLPVAFQKAIADDKKESEKWDVSAPHGPTRDVDFETDEGSWIDLDVSPDGGSIVFDLLGDIYLLPIEGGEAKLLSGGPPMEVQPRFSPDGRQITFTSDRDGGDNIWVMDRDGSNRHAITKEKTRLLNNAVWTPDGQFLIARKHFVNTRSLGAGEMWLYHISGGDGGQLTKRRNWQQNAADPCISPDGRYVYYDEDVSPGNAFEYNRDPYKGIYVINRFDRESGKLLQCAGGPGGAVRPQLSRDGKTLAFVRRVRLNSVLFLRTIETGEGRSTSNSAAISRRSGRSSAFIPILPGPRTTNSSSSRQREKSGRLTWPPRQRRRSLFGSTSTRRSPTPSGFPRLFHRTTSR